MKKALIGLFLSTLAFGACRDISFEVSVPETSVTTALLYFNMKSEEFHGKYSDELERGVVVLQCQKMQTFNNKKIIVPFRISNQGSGVFYYLGLFEHLSDGVRHIKSYFIGDRVKISAINIKENEIVVDFFHRDNTKDKLVIKKETNQFKKKMVF